MSYTLYTTEDCSFCTASKELLVSHNKEFINVILNTAEKRSDFKESTGLKTVPQIYHDSGKLIGGYTEFLDHLQNPK